MSVFPIIKIRLDNIDAIRNELNNMGLVAKPLKNSDFYSVSWDGKTEIKNLKIPKSVMIN